MVFEEGSAIFPGQPFQPGGELGMAEVEVYFVWARGTESKVVARHRMVPDGEPINLLTSATLELLKGPNEEERRLDLFSEIPEGTRLLAAEIKGQFAHVDLTSEFESGGGSFSMRARVNQVVFTATQFGEAKAVTLYLDGHPQYSLGGEGLIIGEPLGRPDSPEL